MLHAQGQLINEIGLMPAGASKDFIARMVITKRRYDNFFLRNLHVAFKGKSIQGVEITIRNSLL